MTLRTPAFNDAKTYGFEWLRYLAELANLQEGVLGATDLKVTAAAGGGMKVDIAAGAGFVKGDSGTPAVGLSQGLFMVVNDAAIANAVTVTASHATLPRIDQIALRVRDSSDLVTGADDATFVVVTGTATSGATLDNRTGAAALPSDYLRLADLLIPAASTQTTAGNTRDRRPWARGAHAKSVSQTGPIYTVGAVLANTGVTLECSGVPVLLTFKGWATMDGTAAQWNARCEFRVDGVTIGSFGGTGSASVGALGNPCGSAETTPAAGRRLFEVWTIGTASTWGIREYQLAVQELVRQDATN